MHIIAKNRSIKAEYTLELKDYTKEDILWQELSNELDKQLLREIAFSAIRKTPEFVRAQMQGHEEVYMQVREYFPSLRVQGDFHG